MRNHTDSEIVEYNEDGSWTTTTTVTQFPMTTTQKVGAWSALTAVCVLPLAPLVGLVVLSKIEEKREARKEQKRLKSVATDA